MLCIILQEKSHYFLNAPRIQVQVCLQLLTFKSIIYLKDCSSLYFAIQCQIFILIKLAVNHIVQ